MSLTVKHKAVIGGEVVALGLMLGGLAHGWHDALTPMFVGGLLVRWGAAWLGLDADSIRNRRERVWSELDRELHRADVGRNDDHP